MAAVDASHAWTTASDEHGILIAATADAGKTWSRLGVPAEIVNVGQLHFVDQNVGWLVAGIPRSTGPGGCFSITHPDCESAVYGTRDGGRSWVRQLGDLTIRGPVFPGSFASLTATDPRHAWVASMRPCTDGDCVTEIAATTDGENWTSVATLQARVGALDFVDADNGFAAAQRPTAEGPSGTASILATHDGGRSWSVILEGGDATWFDFIDRSHGFAVTTDTSHCSMGGCAADLRTTDDGGRTWSVLRSADELWWPVSPTSSGRGFLSTPQFTSASEGWIAVGSGAGATVGGVIHTVDGGRTWTKTDGDPIWTSVVLAPTRGAIWAAALKYGDDTSPAIYRSVDGVRWERTLETRV